MFLYVTIYIYVELNISSAMVGIFVSQENLYIEIWRVSVMVLVIEATEGS